MKPIKKPLDQYTFCQQTSGLHIAWSTHLWFS